MCLATELVVASSPGSLPEPGDEAKLVASPAVLYKHLFHNISMEHQHSKEYIQQCFLDAMLFFTLIQGQLHTKRGFWVPHSLGLVAPDIDFRPCSELIHISSITYCKGHTVLRSISSYSKQ